MGTAVCRRTSSIRSACGKINAQQLTATTLEHRQIAHEHLTRISARGARVSDRITDTHTVCLPDSLMKSGCVRLTLPHSPRSRSRATVGVGTGETRVYNFLECVILPIPSSIFELGSSCCAHHSLPQTTPPCSPHTAPTSSWHPPLSQRRA